MAGMLKSMSLKFAPGTKSADGSAGTATPTNATGIFQAAMIGDAEKVYKFLQSGVDVDAREPKLHRTPLHYASARGKIDVIQLLVHHDCDLEAKDDQGWTAIMYAASAGKEGSLKELLRHGANLNIKGEADGASALHAAATNGDLKMVKALLEGGADPNTVDNAGRTALHYAAAHSSFGSLSELLVGGDPKALDNINLNEDEDEDEDDDFQDAGASNGGISMADPKFVKMNTLLRMATRAARSDEAVIAAILQKGGNINAKDKQGCTPLFQAILVGSDDAAMALLGRGADATAVDTALGRNALHYAAEKGHLALIRRLVKAGTEVNAADQTGYTPLMLAIRKGSERAITALLEAGADPAPATLTDRRTALHMAVAAGDLTTTKALLAKGAPVEAQDVNGVTPLLLAVETSVPECVAALLAGGADANAVGPNGELPVIVAAITGDVDTLQALLSGGADVNARGVHDSSILHVLAEELENFDEEVMKVVLKAGGSLTAVRDEDGLAPVHLAAGSGNGAFLSYVLESGAVPAATIKSLISLGLTEAKVTPLHLAAFSGQDDAVDVLIRAGANVNAKDADGMTALERAEQEGEESIVGMLKAAAAAS